MDDLIYIVLGLAWIIYAAYRTSQKQKKRSFAGPETPPSGQAVPREEPRGMETIFREILGEGASLEQVTFPEAQSYDEITVKELEKERQHYSRPKTTLESIPEVEGISAFDSISETVTTRAGGTGEDGQPRTSSHEEAWFDIRKAVIYAEILNRPYR